MGGDLQLVARFPDRPTVAVTGLAGIKSKEHPARSRSRGGALADRTAALPFSEGASFFAMTHEPLIQRYEHITSWLGVRDHTPGTPVGEVLLGPAAWPPADATAAG